MNGKKILITGGLGNLGSKITIHLTNLGYETYVLSRKAKNKIENVEYKVIEADVSNLDELKQKLNFEIDFCVHTASFNEFFLPGYSEKALKVNTLGTRNLLEVLSGKNIKNFIYFSTFHVYGADSGVIKESSELNPKNDYASTHLFAEYYVKQFGFTHGLQYTILRLTNSYGSPTFLDNNKWHLVLNDLTRSAYENGKIIIKSNGKAKRDYIHMGDVASVVNKLLKIKATNEVYNLSSNKIYTVSELAKIVKAYYKKKFNKDIEIEKNQRDLKLYSDIEVKNDKLKSIIDFKVSDKIADEVSKIFDILQNRK